ncbi:mevalonate kinase [Methanocella sp. CWC-04]|uniref:Mevalonate kinase n=1 Tax=Methanooceanicella nereidis TaxID=2052831 RepID=A0AAP2RB29_9EURY|nr:mevalonate kinase [Methanocella sp. CWC-04]MCD1293889.1 mevalonate kinase [Methanocella sp. CWC-04]
MVICSAPGKIFLFGEHAVVYGKRAIACAIDLRTSVEITSASGIHINSVFKDDPDKNLYIKTAIKKVQNYAEVNNINISVSSKIPVASGLGSSAAVTVATIAALNKEFQAGLDNDQIAFLAYQTELEVQGAASPTDTFVSTMGGTVIVPDRKKLPPITCGVVVGHTGIFKSTSRMVSRVRGLKDRYPEVFENILNAIGQMSERGEKLVLENDYRSIGELMNVNQGLLDAMGVCIPELSHQIYAARQHGAYGAKLTGAGGGGCMVAICDPDKCKDIADAIGRSYGDSFITSPTAEGVRIE